VSDDYRERDWAVWEGIFGKIPLEWYQAPRSDAMAQCLRFFTENPVRRLLDLGCGFGRWAMMLADEFDVVGVDYAQGGVRAASEWAKRTGSRADFVAAGALELPFRPAAFDGILVALLLDNVSREDLGKVMRNVNRVVQARSPGFFVFNPYLTERDVARMSEDNPTRSCMHVPYRDDELPGCLGGWAVSRTGVSKEGFRILEAFRGSQVVSEDSRRTS